MGNIERIFVRISVALSPVEWRRVLTQLTNTPELRQLIFDQLTDALGPEYCAQFESSTGLEVQTPRQ